MTAMDAGAGSGLGPSAREWAATVHLLTAPAVAERTAPFSDHGRQTIGWPGLLQACRPWAGPSGCSSTPRSTCGSVPEATSLFDAVTRLDEVNFARLVEALRLHRGLPAEGVR
ncbi:MAG: hypothetical protein ACRD0K_03400 [Egibacteraceae bacterium]